MRLVELSPQFAQPAMISAEACFAPRPSSTENILRELLAYAERAKLMLAVLSAQTKTQLQHTAANPTTPTRMVHWLAKHPDSDVRAAVAENANAPAEALRILCTDLDPNVRYQLADQYHMPQHILQILSNDENPYVACRAARTLERLAVESSI